MKRGSRHTVTTLRLIALANTKYNWNDLELLYVGRRLAQEKIALLKGCSQGAVSLALRRLGIETRPKVGTGADNPFYGKRHSAETMERIVSHFRGKKPSNFGKRQPSTTGEGNPAKRLEVRHKISERMQRTPTKLFGTKNPNWRGGRSRLPLPYDFRRRIRPLVLIRDDCRCQACGGQDRLQVHHKDFNKGNCRLDNLVTVCIHCHGKRKYKAPKLEVDVK